MKAYFLTFGCKVNQYETAAMEQMFTENGYTLSDTPENADVCIINSCTVTSESDNKVRQALRHLRKINERAVIAVTGCYPQADPTVSDILSDADIVTGTKDRKSLVTLVENFLKTGERIVFIPSYEKNDVYETLSCKTLPGHTRAFLKIEDGCNQFCSYCMIPYSRGRVRSKPPEILKSEVNSLVSSGYHEFVLTGINLAFYGKEYGLSLADAVKIVSKEEGVKRIRLSSLEPEMMTDEEIYELSTVKSLCPSFHLSLQSGCDKTLKAMNRRYTSEEYFALTERIRKYFPDAAFTTDIMTGFPGETESDFEKSMEFARKVGFADIHVFPYSVRKGTAAAEFPNQIDNSVKKLRASRMSELAHEMRRKFLEDNVGKTFPVLFEKEKNDGFHRGFTPNYILIKTLTKTSKKSLRNSFFYVTIERIDDDGSAIGRIVSDEIF